MTSIKPFTRVPADTNVSAMAETYCNWYDNTPSAVIFVVQSTGVSTIASITLGALILQVVAKFHRLVLYKLLSQTGTLCLWYHQEDNYTRCKPRSVIIAFSSFSIGGIVFAIMIAVYIPICIYLMALHNYQFTHKADLCLLIPSILPLLLWAILIVLFHACINCGQVTILTEVIVVVIFFLINIVFTLLTIVPLSCRACGYNMCMKTTATKESHRKALMEVLPLFILTLLPVFSYSFVIILATILKNSNDRVFFLFVSRNVLYGIPGLFSALSVALHLFRIRNRLKNKRRKAICYGTVNQQKLHLWYSCLY